MSFRQHLNPGPGFADLWNELRRPHPHRWPILALSMLVTATLVWSFAKDVWYVEPAKPKVIYITTFDENRTDAQIEASNLVNQKKQDAIRALEEKRAEYSKEMYRELGRATGLDVDAMERQIKQDQAREKAAKEANLRRMLGKDAPLTDNPE